jgi:hypothetical protein
MRSLSSAEVQVEMVLVDEGWPREWGGEVEAALFPFCHVL